jgi:hypothetical protein
VAAEKGHAPAVALLLQHGADPHPQVKNLYVFAALDKCVLNCFTKQPPYYPTPVKSKPHATTQEQQPPRIHSPSHTNPKDKERVKTSPLYLAARGGYAAAAAALLVGVGMGWEEERRAALMVAVRKGHGEVIDFVSVFFLYMCGGVYVYLISWAVCVLIFKYIY